MPNKKRPGGMAGVLVHTKDNIYKIPYRRKNGRPANHYYIKTECSICGKEMYQNRPNTSKSRKAVCSRECKITAQTGKNNVNFLNGIKRKSSGHILIYSPNHLHAKKNYVPEHRVIMEKELNRYLDPSEIIHHINMKNDDNRVENLIIVHSQTEHNKLHWQFVKILQLLMDRGVIKFDKEKKEYFLAEYGRMQHGSGEKTSFEETSALHHSSLITRRPDDPVV